MSLNVDRRDFHIYLLLHSLSWSCPYPPNPAAIGQTMSWLHLMSMLTQSILQFSTPTWSPCATVPSHSGQQKATPGTLGQSDRLFFHYMKDTVKGEESVDFTSFILGMFQHDEPYINERSYPSLCAVCRFNCPGLLHFSLRIWISQRDLIVSY
jgi:hypothetical protein